MQPKIYQMNEDIVRLRGEQKELKSQISLAQKNTTIAALNAEEQKVF